MPADAGVGDGCVGAVVSFPVPTATDNCGPATVECDPASGSLFPVGTTMVTCTATDDCGNTSNCVFDVTVTPTNAVDIEVDLVGSIPATRCIRFVANDCSALADVELPFTDHDGDPDTPVRAEGTIEVPCGNWTMLCAKDRAHTIWGTVSLSLNGDMTRYVTDTVITLEPGDMDDDGDVDINDVGIVLAQFGGPEPDGGCPWDGTQGADMSNNGNVGSEDHSLQSGNWMSVTSCACAAAPEGPPAGRDLVTSIPVARLDPAVVDRLDLNRDGVFDRRDVERFEVIHGLRPSGGLR